ncbi:MAG: MarR family transcriptional regulator [Alphaproteobacteria bacterium]|nr:MarR family transcriptional regulator [Alphaproteobacteria bacterium]
MGGRRHEKPATGAITELVLETFRLNGRLLEAGDELVRDLGLTSARWQVLGAIDASPAPAPVAHVARNMGLSRQAVQRLANEMEKDGLVRFAPNPHHERAKFVLMTDRGEAAFRSAMGKQRRWAERLAEGLSVDSIADAAGVLRELRQRLEKG